MPGTRSRTSAPAAVVEEEDPQEEEAGTGLQFNERLTWRTGQSAIPVGELLRRLQALAQELRNLDQEEADRESILPVAKELANDKLLHHKDRGVKAWTACCLVEVFRLCAPKAPYTLVQLKDVFTLICTTIFPALADPSNPYNSQHIWVLKSLAEVKTIVLLTDVPSADKLILHLFTTCFDILSGPSKADSGEELSKNVEHHMTAVLATLVDESPNLPGEIVDIILAQFLRADPRVISNVGKNKKNQIEERQSTLLLKEAPPAYNMAKNICNSCPDNMARYTRNYFIQVMADTSTTTTTSGTKHRSHRRASDEMDHSDDDSPRGMSEEDLHESRKAHRLLRELWRATPAVLQDIIPQLEAELGTENLQVRLLATETLGDMVAGIGAAGPPPPPVLNPSAYPSQSLAHPSDTVPVYNFLTTPTSPHSFPSRYPHTYQSFLNRRQDRSPLIRSAWATGVGRILMTSAGNVGLDADDEQKLLKYFSDMLVDVDERVRLAAVKAVEQFDFNGIVQKLGGRGGVAEPGSVLCNLADRVKDRKHNVRTDSMKLLGKIWGVAAGVIAEGSERVSTLLGPIPSRILDTYYLNDLETTALADRVLFETLLPLGFPPIKQKASQNGQTASQRVKDSQNNGVFQHDEPDADRIRAERELFLVRDLEQKAKTVLFARQANQRPAAKYMDVFLKRCEDYNGGVMDKGEKEIKLQLGRLIDFYSKTLPDSTRAADDLWKFAKMHDRRSYQLIRFCTAPESDYRKVYKAIKELTKRIEDASGTTSTMLETLTPLIYRSSILLYNRSHVPAIIDFSRTNDKGLGNTAHEVLREISTHNPEVFKAHVQDLCRSLENEAPTPKKPNGSGAVDDLKACAGFARKYPKDIPKDRKFIQAMFNFTLYGSPPKAAKYAVSIIMSIADKREMYAADILQQCTKDFQYGSANYLAKLAALSQLMLVGSWEIEGKSDAVIKIAIEQVLLKPREASEQDEDDEEKDGEKKELDWVDEPDEDCQAKIWALKILVNRLRSMGEDEPIEEVADPVYKLLNTLVVKGGELNKKNPSPKAHKSRLRLLAAQLLLKLCCAKHFDKLLTTKDFNQLATVAQDPLPRVRSGFVNKLMKYLGQDRLSRRFYTIVFLLAFEPLDHIKESAVTWIKARCAAFTRQKDTAMEALFARFLSLLAHHPDFDQDAENLEDFVRYILFYLKCVATEENISLIYHVAQRVKAVQDAIDPGASEDLYCLSDLAQAVVQKFADAHNWTIPAWPSKLRMPSGLFAALPNHEIAQEIADKSYVPKELVNKLDELVKESLRTKKRKNDDGTSRPQKRARTSTGTPSSKPKTLPVRKAGKLAKTPESKKTRKGDEEDVVPSSERRRSGRNAGQKSYAEESDSDMDAEMETWDQTNDEDAGGGAEESEEEQRSSAKKATKTNGVAKGKSAMDGRRRGKQKEMYEISSDESGEELSEPPESDEDG